MIGVTYAIVNQQVMGGAYKSIHGEWAQKTNDAIHQLQEYQYSDDGVEVDSAPEEVASWIIAPHGNIIAKDTALTSSTRVNLEPLALSLSKQTEKTLSQKWGTYKINQTMVLAAAKPLFEGRQYLGTLVSFRSLTTFNRAIASLRNVDLKIGLASILLLIPITIWLGRRSLQPIRVSMQRQRDFVSDAAHELRTPMTILHGTLELAQTESSMAAIQKSIQEGLAETEYMRQLISDLSTLARMDSGVTEINVRPVDLSTLIRDTLAKLRTLAENSSVELTETGLEHTVVMDGDAHRLHQLLVILVENAVKYTPEGGRVQVELRKQRNHVELKVIDNGIGIPSQDLSRIFDRFYRSPSAEKEAHGSGIGLAIAEWIVRTHKGDIHVESNEGKGTTFRVVFPIRLTWKGKNC